MTAVLPPRIVPTLDEVRAERVLPSMSDTAGWTNAKVREIAGLGPVDPFNDERAERASETTWRECAERRPSWSSQPEAAA